MHTLLYYSVELITVVKSFIVLVGKVKFDSNHPLKEKEEKIFWDFILFNLGLES
jgi:hypothetical protein